ncbi:MAG: phosphoribosylglycinamide formyltransferase [Acidobacteriota bacterium]
MKRIGILLSGRGSNFLAIAGAIAQGRLQAEIAVVISNKNDAQGLERARERGLHAVALPSKGLNKAAYDQQLVTELEQHSLDLICLAGYMRILMPSTIARFQGRIVNIHPSLLPSFPGLHAQAQALAHGVKYSGCTVHFVDEGLDSGPILRQAAVPVLDADDEAALSTRILAQEHRIYPEAIGVVLSGKYQLNGRRVVE